jgi:pyruvate kinase
MSPCDFQTGNSLLHARAAALFGSDPSLDSRIMVTFDTAFANEGEKVTQLLAQGMHVARINCAHDDPAVWAEMIARIREAEQTTGVRCKIYMDLAGPKIRTRMVGKAARKGKLEVVEGEPIWLVESEEGAEKGSLATTLKGLSLQLRVGERVLFDDGLIETVVDAVEDGRVKLVVKRISTKKPFIKGEKGINLPDTHLSLSSLTPEDMGHLPFALEHADMIGYSFVRTSHDLQQLQQLIPPGLPIIVKIETPEAVAQLPEILLQGMQTPLFGVMIARGDLAVEIGFERMSEIQEEIVWICEAAHTPVIWATQVLENLNKTGIATRSEITDAAHAAIAECVMVNKGDHVVRVVKVLRDVLSRSGAHHSKKRSSFRALGIAKRFMGDMEYALGTL